MAQVRMHVEDRRRALVAAALRVIERAGLAAATTRAIVAEAGMSLASFHYAFSSRDELLHAVVLEVTETERVEAEAASLGLAFTRAGAELHAREPDLVEAIAAGLNAYIDLLVTAPERELGLLELTLHNARDTIRQPLAQSQYAAYRAAGATALASAARASGARWSAPLDQLAGLLIAITDGITTSWLATRDTNAARFAAAAHARTLAQFAETARDVADLALTPIPRRKESE